MQPQDGLRVSQHHVAIGREVHAPVSYTHLDVYKRQEGDRLHGRQADRAEEELSLIHIYPAIMVPPLRWLASARSDRFTGRRFVATRWREDSPEEAAEASQALF